MIRNDVREEHEAQYKKDNEKPLSVCEGRFYYTNNKGKFIQCSHCQQCHKYKRYMMRIEDVPFVHFHHAESFRRCELFKQIINEDFIRTISIFNALYVNDIACTEIMELFDDIKHKDKESQKLYKALYKRLVKYRIFIMDTVKENGDIDDFADFNELMDNEAMPYIDKIKSMVLDEFKNHNVEDADYLSRVEMARAMVGYSIFSLRTRIKECHRYGIDIYNLHQYELNDIKKVIDNFSDWALRNVGHVDLSKDKFVKAMHELGKKVNDYKMITDNINKTIDKVSK